MAGINENRAVSWRLQSAYVMDQFPLCDYRISEAKGRYVLDALILGDDYMADAFFANIIACVQMLDTRLVIRMAVSNAEDRLMDYVSRWPLFGKTCRLYLDDAPVELQTESGAGRKNSVVRLDPEITDAPFAEIRFYEWDGTVSPADLVAGMEDKNNISWFAVADAALAKNPGHAMLLKEYLEQQEREKEEHPEAGQSEQLRKRKYLITYLRKEQNAEEEFENLPEGVESAEGTAGVEETAGARRSESAKDAGKSGCVTLFPYVCDAEYSVEEKNFSKGINRKAYLLHRYYFRGWNECADRRAMWADFQSDSYNILSSLCSVLSIPYKLRSLGIDGTEEEQARQYWDMVLADEGAACTKNMNRLICLEHLRWMCFMMTEGYDAAGERYKEYAFLGANDQRDKKNRLHICICKCGEGGITLNRLPHDLWDRQDAPDAAGRMGIQLDPLDRMSILFHHHCGTLVDSLQKNGVFGTAFTGLEKAVRTEKLGSELSGQVDFLRLIHGRMLRNEMNANSQWDKACAAFEKVLSTAEPASPLGIEGTRAAFRELKRVTRVVAEFNSYHDYKASDRSILEAIPLLIRADHMYRRIHKPVAGKTWQNVVSSLIIEPEQLYLYTDHPEKADGDLIRSYLEKERGIHLQELRVRSMDDLRNLRVNEASIRSVLDITGLTSEETYILSRMENLKKMPVIAFRDGRIRGLGENTDADYYSVFRRHLTVREVFELQHACIYSDYMPNYMTGLAENHVQIWEAYHAMNSFRYKILSDELARIEAERYWRITKSTSGGRGGTIFWRKENVPRRMLQDSGMEDVLADLQEDKWITGFSLPGDGETGSVTVSTTYDDVKYCLDKMYGTLEKQPYLHHFSYRKTRRQPLTGKPEQKEKYYIYDDTLLVDETIPDETVGETGRGGMHSKKKVLQEALKELMKHKRDNGDGLIINAYGGDAVSASPDGNAGKFRMRFLYRNRATRECLLKEGSILEAYVYHSLWKNTLADDICLNVAFSWDSDEPDDALEMNAVTNETDVICTYNMQTFLISCKQAKPEKDFLQEIKFFADYFGIDGKGILVTSNIETGTDGDRRASQLLSARAKKMGVCYIDRSMLGDTVEKMRQDRLSKYIQNIFDGKEDWEKI